MPETLRLPDFLDGAEFRAPSVEVGQPVTEGAPIASFALDSRVMVMPSTASGVLLRVIATRSTKLKPGDPIALVGAAGETVGYEPERIQCVRISLLNRCTECGNDYPINGLVQRVRCTRCGDVQACARSFWQGDLREAIETARQPGERGGYVALGGASVDCRGMPPLCRKCHTLLDMAALTSAWNDVAGGKHAEIACSRCGELHAARQPPDFGRELFPHAVFVVGEVAADVSVEAQKPVIFKCPSCLAGLEIAGEKRIVRCKYCESDVYLPDDLWLHFNPSAKRARWWMLFTPR